MIETFDEQIKGSILDAAPWDEPTIPDNLQNEQYSKRGDHAFVKFPNAVARDPRVSPGLLVLLCWRATIANSSTAYGLNEKTLLNAGIVKPGTGLGKNAIRAEIANAQKLGYLQRYQPKPKADGIFSHAVDILTLPPCGQSGRAGFHVKRAWFDGSLSRDGMAAFLYMRAGTGNGARVYLRELRERFNWSRPTASKVLGELEVLGLVERLRTRSSDTGRFGGVTYAATKADKWSIWSAVKKPGGGLPGNGYAGNTHTFPLHVLSSREPLLRTARESYDAEASALLPDGMAHRESCASQF